MKFCKKILTLLLACTMLFPVFAGCTKKTSPNSETDIEISFWVSGFRQEFMDAIVEAFNAEYPEYNAFLTTGRQASTLVNTLNLKEDDTVDIYMNSLGAVRSYLDTAEDITALVKEQKIDGEDYTVLDKFDDPMIAAMTNDDDSVSMVAWAGAMTGIMYNADIINGTDYTVPRTSEELKMLCIDLNGDGIKPIVHFQVSDLGYYLYLVKTWQAQYSGLDYFNNTWQKLKDADGNAPSKEVMLSETDGRKQALEALGGILNPQFVLAGSNSDEFTPAQTKFIQGKAAMMVNGAWIQNEMESSGGKDMNMRMMRTPVISSIVDKCPSLNGDDMALGAVVDSVDAVIDGGESPLTGDDAAMVDVGGGYRVTEADWQTIYDARTLVYSNGAQHVMFINKYSNAKAGAQKFLQFYFSDEALKIYTDYTHQAPNATIQGDVTIDQSDWTDFEKDQYTKAGKFTLISDGVSQSALFTKTTVHLYGTQPVINQLSATNSGDRKTAAQIWELFVAEVNKDWDEWMENAGISLE
mgnify:FL=1